MIDGTYFMEDQQLLPLVKKRFPVKGATHAGKIHSSSATTTQHAAGQLCAATAGGQLRMTGQEGQGGAGVDADTSQLYAFASNRPSATAPGNAKRTGGQQRKIQQTQCRWCNCSGCSNLDP